MLPEEIFESSEIYCLKSATLLELELGVNTLYVPVDIIGLRYGLLQIIDSTGISPQKAIASQVPLCERPSYNPWQVKAAQYWKLCR